MLYSLLQYRHGRLVARFPARYMLVCLVLVIGFGAGLYFLQWETNIVRLWNPDDSESGLNFKWLWKTHPPNLRKHSILFKSDNMLTKEHLLKVCQLFPYQFSILISLYLECDDL